jgi:hypothetical protein
MQNKGVKVKPGVKLDRIIDWQYFESRDPMSGSFPERTRYLERQRRILLIACGENSIKKI